MDELTPYKNDKYGGGMPTYLEFIVKTLKPQIDQKYRTKTKRKNTLIMGSSWWISFLLRYLKYPQVFGKAESSVLLWFSDKIFDLTENTINSKIYFLCGDNESEDMVTDLNKMEYLLNTKRCYCLNLNERRL
jgi:predicted alpha/beta superfamily hydrolase